MVRREPGAIAPGILLRGEAVVIEAGGGDLIDLLGGTPDHRWSPSYPGLG